MNRCLFIVEIPYGNFMKTQSLPMGAHLSNKKLESNPLLQRPYGNFPGCQCADKLFGHYCTMITFHEQTICFFIRKRLSVFSLDTS